MSQTLRIAPLGTNRLPNTNIIDFSVRKTFKIAAQLTAEPVMEVFNLTNGNTITNRSNQLGPTYHRVVGILSGRMWRFGFNVKF